MIIFAIENKELYEYFKESEESIRCCKTGNCWVKQSKCLNVTHNYFPIWIQSENKKWMRRERRRKTNKKSVVLRKPKMPSKFEICDHLRNYLQATIKLKRYKVSFWFNNMSTGFQFQTKSVFVFFIHMHCVYCLVSLFIWLID